MDYLVEEARREGTEMLELHVTEEDRAALRLYERLSSKVKHHDVHPRLSLAQ